MGFPAEAQWVKNPTTASQVTAEVWVLSLTQELPYAMGVAIKKKKKLAQLDFVLRSTLHDPDSPPPSFTSKWTSL